MKLRGLYAITPGGADVLAKLAAALEGGVALVQYRGKGVAKEILLQEAGQVVDLAHCHRVPVLINDDVELALEVGADGAHLGREDGDLRAARKRLGARILGASCYNDIRAAREAVRVGADYVAFGAVFASPSKPQAVRAPLSLFKEAKALGVPLAAIGGITLDNAPALIDAGADLLAVISDLFDAPDIGSRARQYGALFS